MCVCAYSASLQLQPHGAPCQAPLSWDFQGKNTGWCYSSSSGSVEIELSSPPKLAARWITHNSTWGNLTYTRRKVVTGPQPRQPSGGPFPPHLYQLQQSEMFNFASVVWSHLLIEFAILWSLIENEPFDFLFKNSCFIVIFIKNL